MDEPCQTTGPPSKRVAYDPYEFPSSFCDAGPPSKRDQYVHDPFDDAPRYPAWTPRVSAPSLGTIAQLWADSAISASRTAPQANVYARMDSADAFPLHNDSSLTLVDIEICPGLD